MVERTNKILYVLTAILLLAAAGIFFVASQSRSDKPTVAAIATDEPEPSLSPEATESAIPQVPNDQIFPVTKVIDGDTIEIGNGVHVRLIGIDTPETVDPRRPVGCFGKEASNFTKQLLNGKMVRLEKDISDTDKYHRLLRYVFLQTPQGEVFVNNELARQGYAQVKTYPPDVKYEGQFLESQREARENNRGLWQACQK